MDSILPSDQYTEVEGRLYVNPQTGLEESSTFIDKLREAQGAQNQEIIEQTQALGTNIPSAQGGLIGPESYFTSRYQIPQNVSAVANLRAAAQAQALNEVLANEDAVWKKRYQDAYRSYQKRQNIKNNSPSGGDGSGTTTGDVEVVGDVDTASTASTIEIDPLTGRPGYYSVVDPYTGIVTDVNMETGENSRRGLTYTDVSVSQMNNEKYVNEEGKNVWGWTFSLPSGKKVGVKYPQQKVVKGSDGNYYKYENGTYSYLGR